MLNQEIDKLKMLLKCKIKFIKEKQQENEKLTVSYKY